MKKRRTFAALLLALLLTAQSVFSLAESYSFPSAGVFIETQADWALLCPETVDGQAETLAHLGADRDALLADWAAFGTVFEVFLPGGVQVRLNCAEYENAAEISDMVWMTDAQREAFRAEYSHAPYENVGFCAEAPDWLGMEWSLTTENAAVRFFWLVTVRQGALYSLCASGANADTDALRAGCLAVLDSLTFLGARLESAADEEAKAAAAVSVPDDGERTPIDLPGYTGLSLEDSYPLLIVTLPGAELLLQTPTDVLRGEAAENGEHTFLLSTRQAKVYSYTLTARADGRAASEVRIDLRRELTGEARMEAYRDSARAVDGAFYEKLASDPAEYQGDVVSFRGKVFEIADLNGLPCALVYSANPGTGVWRDPIRVLLHSAVVLEEGSVYTFYADVRGDSLPGDEEQALAPVVVCQSVN